jgi:hypothetical protein
VGIEEKKISDLASKNKIPDITPRHLQIEWWVRRLS